MKVRTLLIASLAVLGLVGLTVGNAMAVTLGIQIEVFKNGVSQGTAIGGADTTTAPFIVTASNTDTLRFVVQIQGTPTALTSGFNSTVTVDGNNASGGLNELTYVAGSGAILNGAPGFAAAGNPNTSLNDGTPLTGNANQSGTATISTINLYRVDYVVAAVNSDSTRDFTVFLSSYVSAPPGDIANTLLDTAVVRVDSGAAVVPEPASLLLLGSGLAGLAGFFGRKKLRK